MKRLQGAHSKDIGNNKFPCRHVLLQRVSATTEDLQDPCVSVLGKMTERRL